MTTSAEGDRDTLHAKVTPGATSTPFNSARNENGVLAALPPVHQRAVLFLPRSLSMMNG